MHPKPCRKCLLATTDQGDVYATVQAYIAAISPALKTTPAVYERRLAACQTCCHLISGMCVLCGCYVELRAAKKAQTCVESATRWPTDEEQEGDCT